MSVESRVLCGQLLVGGFAGGELSPAFAKALSRGERGGAILFRRNVGTLDEVAALNRAIAEGSPPSLPPIIAVDQEGGRVTRLGPPVLKLPTSRAFGAKGDADLVHRAGRLLGHQLAALGFTLDCAPVLDVDSCADNPIIGDRSFGSAPSRVAELGAAFATGLQAAGVMACGKHFPGHGDTTKDSHLDLPRVEQPRDRLDAVELAPFAKLRADVCASLMTAHVVYPALDAEQPATLSRRIAHDLLRGELGYDGLLLSDDLEMKAVADRMPIEESAVRAVRAGCDVLLICSGEELQERALGALVKEAERDPSFRTDVEAKVERALSLRATYRSRVASPDARAAILDGDEARGLAKELEERGVFA